MMKMKQILIQIFTSMIISAGGVPPVDMNESGVVSGSTTSASTALAATATKHVTTVTSNISLTTSPL